MIQPSGSGWAGCRNRRSAWCSASKLRFRTNGTATSPRPAWPSREHSARIRSCRHRIRRLVTKQQNHQLRSLSLPTRLNLSSSWPRTSPTLNATSQPTVMSGWLLLRRKQDPQAAGIRTDWCRHRFHRKPVDRLRRQHRNLRSRNQSLTRRLAGCPSARRFRRLCRATTSSRRTLSQPRRNQSRRRLRSQRRPARLLSGERPARTGLQSTADRIAPVRRPTDRSLSRLQPLKRNNLSRPRTAATMPGLTRQLHELRLPSRRIPFRILLRQKPNHQQHSNSMRNSNADTSMSSEKRLPAMTICSRQMKCPLTHQQQTSRRLPG